MILLNIFNFFMFFSQKRFDINLGSPKIHDFAKICEQSCFAFIIFLVVSLCDTSQSSVFKIIIRFANTDSRD